MMIATDWLVMPAYNSELLLEDVRVLDPGIGIEAAQVGELWRVRLWLPSDDLRRAAWTVLSSHDGRQLTQRQARRIARRQRLAALREQVRDLDGTDIPSGRATEVLRYILDEIREIMGD